MPDLEALKWFASLGVGGALAGVVFFFYRRDFLQEREKHERREALFVDAIREHARATERLATEVSVLDLVPSKIEHAIRNAMSQALLECQLRQHQGKSP